MLPEKLLKQVAEKFALAMNESLPKPEQRQHQFSDEQIRNLGIITRLYEGKTEDFEALLTDYRAKLADAPELSDDEDIMPKSYWQSNIDWLTERFSGRKIQRCCRPIQSQQPSVRFTMTTESLLVTKMTVSVIRTFL